MSTDVASPKGRRASILRIVLTILICLVAAAAIYVRNLTKSRATPPPPLPVPNAYDDVIRAAKLVTGTIPNQGKLKEAKPDDLRQWVALNAEAIKIVRSSLGQESRVPMILSTRFIEETDRFGQCRQLGRVLLAEGELALVEGRADDAARAFLDVVVLGPAVGRGGVLMDGLVALAIERTGLDGLNRSRKGMSPEALRRAIVTLREVDAGRDTFAQMRNQEQYWSEHSIPFYTRLMFKISGAEKLMEPALKAGQNAVNTGQAMNRRTTVDLATQLYAIDHKAEPADPSALVPDYLPEIPENPLTGEPITGPKETATTPPERSPR